MRTNILILILVCFFFQPTLAFTLTINRLNGGASVTYIDFSISGNVVPLEIIRTYNSITAINEKNGWNGAFGWGWTSPFETTLTTTPERHVLLRDGTTGNTIVFKPRKEDPQVRKTFFSNVKRAYFEQQKRRKLSKTEISKLQLPNKFLTKLKSDPNFRNEIAVRYNIMGEIPKGELLISSEYGYQTIQFKNNQWIRENSGVTQYFDRQGRLIRRTDKNGYYFIYEYSQKASSQLSAIRSQDQALSLKFKWKNNHIVEITDNRDRKAEYSYNNQGNLTKVIDSTNQIFAYKYLNKRFPHLLTRIEYPSDLPQKKTDYRKIRYNKKGLAIYHKDRDGSETSFTFGKAARDPKNNFWTKSIKKFKGKQEERYDEYSLRKRPNGTKYLHKQKAKFDGVTTTIIYTECCGKPSQVLKNGVTTYYKYYPNGLLREKTNPKEEIQLEYDPRWKKITKVKQNDLLSEYAYDAKGNLIKASNSKKEKVLLKYDRFGRISSMVDNKKQTIDFEYGDNGKPSIISQKGVGTIRIDYDPSGRIRNARTISGLKKKKLSQEKSQKVIRDVMRSFQNLLNIIRPAGINFAGV